MKFTPTRIPDVILIEPRVFEDSRGFFMETFQAKHFQEVGVPTGYVQDNQSGSHRGSLRGLHYQIKQAQGKLIRVVAGMVFDVCVDLRRSSQSFGQWVGVELSAANKQQLWIPPGFAHGFYVCSDWAEIIYKATDYYAPEWERTLLWNDPDIGIEWPIGEAFPLLISEKDMRGAALKEADVFDDL